MQNTLLFVQSDSQSVDIYEQLETSLQSLQQLEHVTVSNTTQDRTIEVTPLGQATFKGKKFYRGAICTKTELSECYY